MWKPNERRPAAESSNRAIDHSAARTEPAPLPQRLDGAASPLTAKELRAWYISRVHDSPEDKKPPSESEDWAAARLVFPKITRDRIRSLRADHAKPLWKRKGRPRST